MVRATTALPDIGGKSLSAFQRSIDVHRMALCRAAGIEPRIVDDLDPRNEIENSAVSEPIRRELFDEGIAVYERDRCNVVSVHLRRDHLARLVRPSHVELPFPAHRYGQLCEVAGS